MNHHRAEEQERRPTAKDLYRLALAVIAATAIVRELRKPPEERTWHGTVVGFVPYDFRRLTMDRLRATYWNPEGSIISRCCGNASITTNPVESGCCGRICTQTSLTLPQTGG